MHYYVITYRQEFDCLKYHTVMTRIPSKCYIVNLFETRVSSKTAMSIYVFIMIMLLIYFLYITTTVTADILRT